MALIGKSDYSNIKKRRGTKAVLYIILTLILSVHVVLSSCESPFFFAYLWDKDYEMNSKTCTHWSQGEKTKEGSNRLWVSIQKHPHKLDPHCSFLAACVLWWKITPVSTEQSLVVTTVAIFLRKRSQLYSFQPSFSPEWRIMLPLFTINTSRDWKTTAEQS